MKDLRMEVRKARIKRGVKYTALLNKSPDYVIGSKLAGKRVTIKSIRRYTGRYGYMVNIVGDTFVYPDELSEWREE